MFGQPLIDDPDRFGAVTAVGLAETLAIREGPYRRQLFATQIVDVQRERTGPGSAERRDIEHLQSCHTKRVVTCVELHADAMRCTVDRSCQTTSRQVPGGQRRRFTRGKNCDAEESRRNLKH